MRIVVLDGQTLNPGDLSWQALAELGALTVHDRTPSALVVERAEGAEVLVVNKVAIDAGVIAALPMLRHIAVTATGVNNVDLEAAARRGIAVTNVPAYSTRSVAQHVFALLLELTRGAGHHAARVRQGGWARCPDFSFWVTPQRELAGLTFGVVGFGAIGRCVARLAAAFEMTVLVHTRTPDAQQHPEVRFVGLEELLREADVVSLHCPLTGETEQLVNAQRLALMKRTALLINTGRGPLIDEAALAAALAGGQIAGAGLDVLSQEPPQADNPLLDAPNCLVTPHMAWATGAARQRLMDTLVGNVAGIRSGSAPNRVC